MNVRFSILAWLLFCCSLHANAQNDPVIKLVTEQWAPANYMDQQGKIVGYATKKVKKIMKVAGFKYSLSLYPWARSYHLAKTNAYTGIYSILRSPQRDAHFHWVCPIAYQESLYMIRLAKRNDIILNTIQDAKRYTLAISRDVFDHQLLLQHQFIEGKHFQITAGIDVNMRLLLNGNADLIIATPSAVHNSLKAVNGKPSQIVMELALNKEKSNPLCLAFGLKTPQSVVDRLQKALDETNVKEQMLKTQ